MEPQRQSATQTLIFLAAFLPFVLVWLIICGIGAIATGTGGGMFRDGSSGKMNPMWGLAAFAVPIAVLIVRDWLITYQPSAALKRRVAGAFVVVALSVIGFVVTRNAWQERERVAAEVAAKVAAEVAAEALLPTADEFRARWVGAKNSELGATMGWTKFMYDAPKAITRYHKVARNPENNRAYQYVDVQLSPDGRIIDVAFFP